MKGTLRGREMEYQEVVQLTADGQPVRSPADDGEPVLLPAETAWNGEFLTCYEPYTRGGIIAGRDRMPIFPAASLLSCRCYHDGNGYRPLSEALSQYSGGGAWVCAPETVAGVWTYPVLIADSNPAKGPYRKIWLAPNYGFSPVRFERGDAEGQSSVTVYSEFAGYSEVASGVWFPREISNYAARTVSRFLVESVQVNSGLPDSDFTLRFPAGTHVEDERTDTRFVVPAANDGPPAKERFVAAMKAYRSSLQALYIEFSYYTRPRSLAQRPEAHKGKRRDCIYARRGASEYCKDLIYHESGEQATYVGLEIPDRITEAAQDGGYLRRWWRYGGKVSGQFVYNPREPLRIRAIGLPLPDQVEVLGFPLSTYLEKLDFSVKALREEVDGAWCNVLEGDVRSPDTGKVVAEWRAWVDEKLGFLPRRCQGRWLEDGQGSTRRLLDYREVSKGVWVPYRMELEGDYVAEDGQREHLLNLVIVKRFSLDAAAVPEALFHVEFPSDLPPEQIETDDYVPEP